MKRGLVAGVLLLGVATALWFAPGNGPREQLVVRLDDVLDFPGATGWRAGACKDASCAGAWTHESGLAAEVLVVPIPDPRRLPELAGRLQRDVVGAGGRVDPIPQAGGLIRMLRPANVDGVESVIISYVLPAPDQRAVHILTASAALVDQERADERVRDLLAFAAWVRPEPSMPGAPAVSDGR